MARRTHEALDGAAMKALKAEFDRVWATRIVRARDVIEVAGAIP